MARQPIHPDHREAPPPGTDYWNAPQSDDTGSQAAPDTAPEVDPDADPEVDEIDAEHEQIEAEVFGEDVLRNPDGSPMERGHGSNYARAIPEAKAHYHAVLNARNARAEVAKLEQELVDARARLDAKREAAERAAEKHVAAKEAAEKRAAKKADRAAARESA
jgi:hypothetical protein